LTPDFVKALSGRSKVFAVAYGGGHITMVIPVVKALHKYHIDVVLLALTAAYPRAIQSGLPAGCVKSLRDYVELFESDIDEILSYGLDLLDKNYNPASGISKFESLLYLGLSMRDLVADFGFLEAAGQYQRRLRQAFSPHIALQQIIKHENPDLVLATTSPRMERAALIAANQLAIPTVQLVDMFADFYPPPEGQNLVVMNKLVKQGLIDRGFGNRSIHVLGQPALDETVSMVSRVNPLEVRRRLGIPVDRKILLFTAKKLILHNPDNSFKAELDSSLLNKPVFDVLKDMSNKYGFAVIVRARPGEDPCIYSPYYESHPSFYAFRDEALNLFESISISDYVLTYFSTIALEAVLCGKTVFTFLPPWPMQSIEEYKHLPFFYSEGFDELRRSLDKVIGGSMPDGVEKMTSAEFFVEPESADKIANLIMQTMASQVCLESVDKV
jgi:hypothetical protein